MVLLTSLPLSRLSARSLVLAPAPTPLFPQQQPQQPQPQPQPQLQERLQGLA